MKMYIQIDSDDIVHDIVTMEVEGYQEVDVQLPLPEGVYGGWWKFIDGEFIEIPELKPISPEDEIKAVRLELSMAIAELTETLLGGN